MRRVGLPRKTSGSLTVDLFAPGMTALHRVGLAGLAMTLRALESDGSAEQLRNLGAWRVSQRDVAFTWHGDGTEFFSALLKASFRLTDDGLIWLPALGHPLDQPASGVVLHNAMLGTFLQHGKSRGNAAKQAATLSVEIDDQSHAVSFLPLSWYAHQCAKFNPSGKFRVAGWLYPGGTVRHVQATAVTTLAEEPARALALLFAPVGAIYFQIHRRTTGVRPQYCLVVPEINDLLEYAEARQLFQRQGTELLHVAGAAEAAVRVTAELEARGLHRGLGSSRCTVVAFGSVPWSPRQKTRVARREFREARSEHLTAYRVATNALHPRLVSGKPDPETGQVSRWWHVPQVPDLVAENVIVGAPWWHDFAALWQRVRDTASPAQRERALADEKGGLHTMVTDSRTMPDGPEARLVRACQEAWRRRLGALGERSHNTGTPFSSLASREYERVRISFARCKNAAMLRQTLTDFWSRAGSLPDLQDGWAEILPLLQSRWQDARDLALLALASYKPQNSEEDEALASVDQGVEKGVTP